MKDSHNMCTYCTWNGSCVGSDIGMGSWSVSIPTQVLKLCIDRLNAEGGTNFVIAWRLPSASSLRWFKYSLCMTSQPVFRLSLQLTRVAA